MDVNTPELKEELPKVVNVNPEPAKVAVEEPKMVSLEEFEQLKRTNERLLDESKRNKLSKQKIEEEKLFAEGKKEEVIESLRGRLNSFEEKEEQSSIAAALAAEGQKRNCEHWDLLYNSQGGSGIEYNKETGEVLGVQTFYDNAEMDERLRQVYFGQSSKVTTDNSVPSIGGTANYSKDPLAYLEMIKKERGIEEYQRTVDKMIREGVIR